jgi:hypothetical protein
MNPKKLSIMSLQLNRSGLGAEIATITTIATVE